MPSAILCCDKIETKDMKAACDFTNFAIKHGLRKEGWVMPIVVVKKKVYEKLQQQKKLEILNKQIKEHQHTKNEERGR